jgi:P-type conjugative transfer protein TrbJ
MRSPAIRHATAAIILALATSPAASQIVVYDPSNYAQNVLQAARALQQINNQITSLQNQTQMLLNQARNLGERSGSCRVVVRADGRLVLR